MGGLWIGIGVVVAGVAWAVFGRRKRVFVLGEQMAAANKAEAEWRPEGPSVMPDLAYDEELGDHDLLALQPSTLDNALRTLTRSYAQLDDRERERVRGSIDQSGLYTLIHFVKRSAVLALRTKDQSPCIDGLNALEMIDLERVDHRDHAWARGILDWVAAAVGHGERSAEDRTLEIWGYRAVETEHGIGMVRSGGFAYSPIRDLLAIVRRVTALLNDDKLFAYDIEVATEIPDAWFEKGSRAGIVEVLATARAVVQTTARLRRDIAGRFDHLVTCWIAEMQDGEASARLADRARGPLEGGGAAVGFAGEELFCLFVSRPTTQGVAPLHTPDEIDAIASRIRSVVADSLNDPGDLL